MFEMLWLPNEARYGAVKLWTDRNIQSLIPHEDKNFGGSLVLDFRKLWRHVKTIYLLGGDFRHEVKYVF